MKGKEKPRRIYIVTYRYMADPERGIWTGDKISQEAYTSLEDAQRYIQTRPEHPVKVTEMYYTTDNREEYYIHDVLVKGG